MAEPRTSEKQQQGQQQTQQGLERSRGQQGRIARRDPFGMFFGGGPFTMMRRMQEEMDRLFEGFGFGPSWQPSSRMMARWTPAIEVFERGQEFVVRADLPGLSRNDLNVELGENTLTISGERKWDHEEEQEGVYRSERGYGWFQRVIPLPEGVITDSAKATFKNGVLEIVMQAPPQEVRKGRRIEISE
ncbi:MAG TPA: Hsp20/alpha crystallin family protein [Vicinamibacterales bacterium]